MLTFDHVIEITVCGKDKSRRSISEGINTLINLCPEGYTIKTGIGGWYDVKEPVKTFEHWTSSIQTIKVLIQFCVDWRIIAAQDAVSIKINNVPFVIEADDTIEDILEAAGLTQRQQG